MGRHVTILAALSLLTAACADADGDGPADAETDAIPPLPPLVEPVNSDVVPRTGLFEAGVTRVVLEVDYQTGAAPETGRYALGTRDAWGIFNTNIRRIFREAPQRDLVVPTTLDEMQELEIEPPADGGFSVSDILGIARAHQDGRSTNAERVFYVLFLDGYLRTQSGDPNTQIIGVSLGATGIIAMFKPVIRQSSVARFVEQTTLVHEFGHAIGLVANGLPTTGPHHDAEHGAHCANRDCVMYYAHEGLADLASWVARVLATGDSVLFGAECLGDIDAAAAR
jgi:hypothetical protein